MQTLDCMSNLVHPPRVAVRQANPLYALVVSVVDSLFDMLILKFAADSFDFKQECKTALELDREVAQTCCESWASPDFADTLQEVDNAEIGGQEMSTKRRKFTDEYKAEAVRIWRESGKSVRRVAVELGLTPSALERWVKQEKDAQQLGTTRASLKAEREELLRLRRENELLRQERDFLRSAAAYFAKERK